VRANQDATQAHEIARKTPVTHLPSNNSLIFRSISPGLKGLRKIAHTSSARKADLLQGSKRPGEDQKRHVRIDPSDSALHLLAVDDR
jgi:hypothetical protein